MRFGKKQVQRAQLQGVMHLNVEGINLSKEDLSNLGLNIRKEPALFPMKDVKVLKDGDIYKMGTFHVEKFKTWYKSEFGKDAMDSEIQEEKQLKAEAISVTVAFSYGDRIILKKFEWYKDRNVVELGYANRVQGEHSVINTGGFTQSMANGKLKVWINDAKEGEDRTKWEAEGAERARYKGVLDCETRGHRKGGIGGFRDFIQLFKAYFKTAEYKTDENMSVLDRDFDFIQFLGGEEMLYEGDFSKLNELIEEVKDHYTKASDRGVWGVLGKTYRWGGKQAGKDFTVVGDLFRSIAVTAQGTPALLSLKVDDVAKILEKNGIINTSPLPNPAVEITAESQNELMLRWNEWKKALEISWQSFRGKSDNSNSESAINSQDTDEGNDWLKD